MALLFSSLLANGQTAQTNAPAPPLQITQSVFVDNPNIGKDPFFPESTRRQTGRPVSPGTPVAPQPQRSPFDHLTLKGISGPANRRLALINNRTCETGEEVTIKTPDGPIKVRCLEIRERSVVVSVEGEPERKEFMLREGP